MVKDFTRTKKSTINGRKRGIWWVMLYSRYLGPRKKENKWSVGVTQLLKNPIRSVSRLMQLLIYFLTYRSQLVTNNLFTSLVTLLIPENSSTSNLVLFKKYYIGCFSSTVVFKIFSLKTYKQNGYNNKIDLDPNILNFI